MINRSDLVKQFELVVQQEIKNHNASILATNLSINKIRKDIEALSNRLTSVCNLLHSNEVNATFITNKKLNDMDIYLKKQVQKVSEEQLQFGKKIKELKESTDEKMDKVLLPEELESFKEIILRSIERETKERSDALSVMVEYTRILKREVLLKIDDLYKEITEMIIKKDKPIKDIENKIVEVRIDKEGILKEVSVCKKTNMIHEKKLENIYTLIERMKNKT